MVMAMVRVEELIESVMVNTQEAAAYVKYFDFLRSRGKAGKWRHFRVRFFRLSVSYMGQGYYSALQELAEPVEVEDPAQLENVRILKGWIFQKDIYGQFWVIVDGDEADFEEFKQKYRDIMMEVA